MNLKAIIASLILSSCASYKSDQSFKKIKGVNYGDHKRQVGDLYLTEKKNAPIVFTVHGGSWSNRSHEDMSSVAESLASHGYNVFNISYRFAPEFKHPSPIEDLNLAIEFIKNNHANLIDFNKIALWGYSSGAHIALMHGLKSKHSIQAIIAGGGPYDFSWWPGSPIITPYMGYSRDENIQGWLDASPISHLTKESPSLFLYHGKEDELVAFEQMTALDAKAKLKGIDIETYLVEFWGHTMTFVFSSKAIEKAISFLNKRLL